MGRYDCRIEDCGETHTRCSDLIKHLTQSHDIGYWEARELIVEEWEIEEGAEITVRETYEKIKKSLKSAGWAKL